MDRDLKDAFNTLAAAGRLQLAPSGVEHLDQYISRFFPQASSEDVKTIQAYLGNAAFSIARREALGSIGATEMQHAIWLYHDIEDLDTLCRAAGQTILRKKDELRGTLHPIIREALYGRERGLGMAR
jgi:hypothetical protein